MELKVKILFQDRVKPTDFMQFGGEKTRDEISRQVIQKLEGVVNQILDDNDPVTGIYISRE